MEGDPTPGVRVRWTTPRSPYTWLREDLVLVCDGPREPKVVAVAELAGVEGIGPRGHFIFYLRRRTGQLARPVALGVPVPTRSGVGTVVRVGPVKAKALLAAIAKQNPSAGEELERAAEAKQLAERAEREAKRGLVRRRMEARAAAKRIRTVEYGDASMLREGPNVAPGRGIATLSVRQPWAWAILHAGKDVENRAMNCTRRGRIALHASAAPPSLEALEECEALCGLHVPDELPLGCIVGTVEVVGTSQASPSPWAIHGAWHWQLAAPRVLEEPLPAKGAVGWWFFDAVAKKRG
ncbi:MAG: hypothetical protein IT371_12095 [Deltaproteobacteria bacterium]|nr:hypothetical protein [Deltaproteobacteria bacterium]